MKENSNEDFQAIEGNENWDASKLDLIEDKETEIKVSPIKENESEVLNQDKARNNLELECSMIMNDFSKDNMIQDTESELLQEGDLYTDKNVMESEVLDSIVSDHDVKDICVDEGVKINDDVTKEETIVTKMLPLENYGTRSFLRAFMASDFNSSEPDVADKTGSSTETIDQLIISHDSIDKNSNNPFMVSEFQNTNEETLVDLKKGNNPFVIDEVENSITETIHQTRFNPFEINEIENVNIDEEVDIIHKPSSNPFEVENTTSESVDQQELRTITNPFIEVQSSTINGEIENNDQTHEIKRNNPFDESFEARDDLNHDGEASFSATGPVSGRITFAGAIAYSGSTSVRSDSSTTSTRSFAFPVLQGEWNSSPVRMRKAEGRNFRKHKGWKQGILCCKF